jgi:hypothetical protein
VEKLGGVAAGYNTPIYTYAVPTGGYDSNGNVLAYTDSVMEVGPSGTTS